MTRVCAYCSREFEQVLGLPSVACPLHRREHQRVRDRARRPRKTPVDGACYVCGQFFRRRKAAYPGKACEKHREVYRTLWMREYMRARRESGSRRKPKPQPAEIQASSQHTQYAVWLAVTDVCSYCGVRGPKPLLAKHHEMDHGVVA